MANNNTVTMKHLGTAEDMLEALERIERYVLLHGWLPGKTIVLEVLKTQKVEVWIGGQRAYFSRTRLPDGRRQFLLPRAIALAEKEAVLKGPFWKYGREDAIKPQAYASDSEAEGRGGEKGPQPQGEEQSKPEASK